MNYQYHPFHHGKFFGEEGIEDDTESRDRDDEEGPMPILRHVIGPVQNQKALNHSSREESKRCQAGLPSQHRGPACMN